MTTAAPPALDPTAETARTPPTPSTDVIVSARGISHAFDATPVLDGVDLDVVRGTVCALLGPNGAGKTTMINILSTLLRADAGRATVNGHDVVDDPQRVKQSISLTGQYAAVDDILTGRENLVMLGRLNHLGRRRSRARADELLEQFDLVDAGDRRVATYSGGMRRRLDIAGGLVADPPVIFLDEPTTGLDPRARQTMWGVIDTLVAGGTTVLLTTQYLDEADRLADRIAVLAGGRIIAEGTPSDLKRRIPGEQVEVGFGDVTQLHAAALALAASDGTTDPDRRTIVIATDGSPAAVKGVLDRLDAAKVPVASLDLRRPTLDDVFFLLTTADPTTDSPTTEGGRGR